MKPSKGFTLIEVLVVVAIICLAGFHTSAIACRGTRPSQDHECLTNLHQAGKATTTTVSRIKDVLAVGTSSINGQARRAWTTVVLRQVAATCEVCLPKPTGMAR